jgi:hypothetical protein
MPRHLTRRAHLAALLLATCPAWAADDDAAIRAVLMQQFDKPEARLQVDPVVAQGEHAVAGWVQGERGGRALLRRQHGHWQIAACAGDALKDPRTLREAGVPGPDADRLARTLANAEARLPAATRQRLSSFDGLVRMDAAGQHPPH